MKYLIVNADDLGIGRGTNRGIMEANRDGIVTSASLLVTTPWAEDASRCIKSAPALSVGLHVDLDPAGDANAETEVQRQFERFVEVVGSPPTHIDSHHNTHRDPRILPHILRVASQHGLSVRGHSRVRYCSKFYGQWGGDTHLEQISVDSLVGLLKTEVRDGVTELSCHPGYADADLRSRYAAEREAELRTLCDPRLPAILAAAEIRLMGFRDLPALVTGVLV